MYNTQIKKIVINFFLLICKSIKCKHINYIHKNLILLVITAKYNLNFCKETEISKNFDFIIIYPKEKLMTKKEIFFPRMQK